MLDPDRRFARLCLLFVSLLLICGLARASGEASAKELEISLTDAFRVALGFVFCVAAAGGLLVLLNRKFRFARHFKISESDSIERAVVLQSIKLDITSSLHVVEWGGRRYLLAKTSSNVTLLDVKNKNET